MRVLRGAPSRWDARRPFAVAVGVFDGVHTGHREVLRILAEVAQAQGVAPAVLTFHPHPLSLVAPGKVPRMLTTIDQRIEQLGSAGVELVAVLAFDESVRTMSAELFVSDLLVGHLHAAAVVAGEDFRFGEGRVGDAKLLRRMANELGFEAHITPLLGGAAPVSSTRIRAALGEGDLSSAAALLGRNYELAGTVVLGSGRGTELGVSTANLSVDSSLAVPGRGVYAVMAEVLGEQVPAVANVGVRPTFGEVIEIVEVHLIDRYMNVLDEAVRIEFVQRIRDERRFAGVADLADQIRLDIETARSILS